MIGILALQGNYQMHHNMLSHIGERSIFVKTADDLNQCNGLIIPGGESTVISKMMFRYNLLNPIKEFSKNHSIFGTCAGLILMTNYNSDDIQSLAIIDANILRNGWGRQLDSFTQDIQVNFKEKYKPFKATFIRAPRIKKTGISVNVLSSINKEPIMIREGRHIGTAFHPEIHGDPLIHKYFLKIINGK